MVYQWFQHISFANPYWFLLFLLLPILVYWYVKKWPDRQSTLTISSTQLMRPAGSWKKTFRHIPFVCRMIAVSFLILAMARPQTRNDEELQNGEGIDIVLCIDVSGSMMAQDLKPDRMEAAKQVAANFVAGRATDRIAVVIFSGESFTVVPLTTDKQLLQSQIYAIQRGMLIDGTAIGDGLGVSVDRLRNSPSKSKVIILLTDGENQGGRIDPLAGMELAKSYGIRVYTIGVGSEGFAPVPVQMPNGMVSMQQQKVNIDEKLLRRIADETGGLYFRARDNVSLKKIYDDINRLEKSKVEVTTLKRYTEQFYPLAMLAAAFLLLEIILNATIFRKYP